MKYYQYLLKKGRQYLLELMDKHFWVVRDAAREADMRPQDLSALLRECGICAPYGALRHLPENFTVVQWEGCEPQVLLESYPTDVPLLPLGQHLATIPQRLQSSYVAIISKEYRKVAEDRNYTPTPMQSVVREPKHPVKAYIRANRADPKHIEFDKEVRELPSVMSLNLIENDVELYATPAAKLMTFFTKDVSLWIHYRPTRGKRKRYLCFRVRREFDKLYVFRKYFAFIASKNVRMFEPLNPGDLVYYHRSWDFWGVIHRKTKDVSHESDGTEISGAGP